MPASTTRVCVRPFDLPVDERNRLLAKHDCLVLFPGVLDDEAVRAAANLQLIQLVSAGYDRINVKLCRELGVPVANNGGTNSLDVAEHAPDADAVGPAPVRRLRPLRQGRSMAGHRFGHQHVHPGRQDGWHHRVSATSAGALRPCCDRLAAT